MKRFLFLCAGLFAFVALARAEPVVLYEKPSMFGTIIVTEDEQGLRALRFARGGVKLLHEGHAKGAMETRFEWGGDFGAPDESYLSANYDKPLMVHHYPAEVKAFYMARCPDRNELALGVDVLAPEGYGEVIGGGERATSLEFLKEQIALHQLPQEAFEWYLDLRRYGSVPHAGFGMGIERCTAWMCGIEHVRETIPFPRLMNRLRP